MEHGQWKVHEAEAGEEEQRSKLIIVILCYMVCIDGIAST